MIHAVLCSQFQDVSVYSCLFSSSIGKQLYIVRVQSLSVSISLYFNTQISACLETQ